MKCKRLSNNNKKVLNSSNTKKKSMKKGVKKKNSGKLKGAELVKAIKEAQKDPEFMKEVDLFIKATT